MSIVLWLQTQSHSKLGLCGRDMGSKFAIVAAYPRCAILPVIEQLLTALTHHLLAFHLRRRAPLRGHAPGRCPPARGSRLVAAAVHDYVGDKTRE